MTRWDVMYLIFRKLARGLTKFYRALQLLRVGMFFFFYNRHYFFLTIVQYNLTTYLTTIYSAISASSTGKSLSLFRHLFGSRPFYPITYPIIYPVVYPITQLITQFITQPKSWFICGRTFRPQNFGLLLSLYWTFYWTMYWTFLFH